MRVRVILILSLIFFLSPLLLADEGGVLEHTGARSNDGVAVCLIGNHTEIEHWTVDPSIDCGRYEK